MRPPHKSYFAKQKAEQRRASPQAPPDVKTPGVEVRSITLKFSAEQPPEHFVDYRGWKLFHLVVPGVKYEIAVRPKNWNKLLESFTDASRVTITVTAEKFRKLGRGHYQLEEAGLQYFAKKRAPSEVDGAAPAPNQETPDDLGGLTSSPSGS